MQTSSARRAGAPVLAARRGAGRPAGLAPWELLQRSAGNAAAAAFYGGGRMVQRQAEDDVDETGAATEDVVGETDGQGADGEAADADAERDQQVVEQIENDDEQAYGVRVGLDEGLVAAAAGRTPTSLAPSGTPPAGPPPPTTLGRVSGPAFADDDVSAYRVRQGQLGDCYLMAAIAAVARANPDAIRRLIRNHPPNQYDVTLYEHRWLVSDATHVETVDDRFPVGADGQPMYGNVNLYRGESVGSHPELWPLIIEKAYAQWKGGYAAINGGFTTDAEEALTGHEASTYFVDSYQPHEIGHRIHAAQREGKAVTASTATMPSDMTVSSRGLSAGEGVGTYHGHSVAYPHAYAVENVEEDVDTIDLQNPWGYNHIEDMALADFKHTFNTWETDRT